MLFAVIAVVELDGRLSTFVEHLFESRLTAEQRLDRLADLTVDRTLNISGSIAWMRQCKETTPADTVPYDHMCVANDSNLVMLVGTLRGLLHTVYAAQVGTERVDLAAWARGRFGVPSGSCVRDTGGVNFALTWWTRPKQTIVAATISGPERFVMHTLSLLSRRFDNELPSCDEDAGPDVLRPTTLNAR